jgi:DNA-binding MarR family transcriptional regulator
MTMNTKTSPKKVVIVQNGASSLCVISTAQHQMLVFIRDHPGALYDEVAEHIGFNRPSTTTYASRLEKIGLIFREQEKIDGKWRTLLYLQENVQLHLKVLYST